MKSWLLMCVQRIMMKIEPSIWKLRPEFLWTSYPSEVTNMQGVILDTVNHNYRVNAKL